MHQPIFIPVTTVRPRTDADFPGLEKALRQCHAATGWPLEGIQDAKSFLCDDQGLLEQAWVAEYNGEIAGHIAINQPENDCSAVAKWVEQNGNDDRIAVVGRLFVNPVAKAKGVVRALSETVTQWSQDHDAQLIMYVVVWSAARVLAAEAMSARFGWQKYGDTFYMSPMDGRKIDAMCYAAPLEHRIPIMHRDITIKPKLRTVTMVERFTQLGSSLGRAWRNPGSKYSSRSFTCLHRLTVRKSTSRLLTYDATSVFHESCFREVVRSRRIIMLELSCWSAGNTGAGCCILIPVGAHSDSSHTRCTP
jgi:predicted GNAT superfamily acetyltransferase